MTTPPPLEPSATAPDPVFEAMVERGAAALGTWINAQYPPAWALGAARIVLNAALSHEGTDHA